MKTIHASSLKNHQQENIEEIQYGQIIYYKDSHGSKILRPREEGEEVLGLHVPYLSDIGALMYLANNTRQDIEFTINLLARHSAAPTKRNWVGIKMVFRYLYGTRDLGLFYSRNQDLVLLGYTDAGYL